MIDLDALWRWWVQAMLTSTILLACGSLAVAVARAPVRRVRLVVLTLAACLTAPGIGFVPGIPRWSVPVLPSAAPARPALGKVAPAPPRPAPLASPRAEEPPQPPRPGATLAARPALPTCFWPGRFDCRPPVLVAWLAVALAWLGWWVVGMAVLGWITRWSRAAPITVQSQFDAIAGPAGATTRLLVADPIRSPITFTWGRPMILLPGSLIRSGDEREVNFALAHEWAHVERGDFTGWTLGTLAGTLVSWNPLYWYLRRQLRLSQDYLADDRAASVGTPELFAAHLVRLARTRSARRSFHLPALGIDGRRSHLTKRITMLIEDRPPHATRCHPLWTGTVASVAALIVAGAVGIRLEAAPAQGEPNQAPPGATPPQQVVSVNSTGQFGFTAEPQQAAPGEQHDSFITVFAVATRRGSKDDAPDVVPTFGPGSREWTGRVVDKVTGRPVAGAQVKVHVTTGNPSAPNSRRFRTTTPPDGSYRFSLTPEEQADPSLFLSVGVEHPDHVLAFVTEKYRKILKQIELGQPSIFANLKMQPAAPVEGLVLTPNGVPAVGVQIQANSIHYDPDLKTDFSDSCATRTDVRGRFRLPLHAQGDAVLWLLTDQFEPAVCPLQDTRRGDLGTFRLGPGLRIRGQVVDAAGRPVPGVHVTSERVRPFLRPRDSKLTMLTSASNNFIRSAVTRADGTFTLAPMPPGPVEIYPSNENKDPLGTDDVHRPLPAAYLRQKITLEAGKEPEAITFRPADQVTVTAQLTDSKGVKTTGNPIGIQGTIDGQPWTVQCEPSPEGLYTMVVPKGLVDASLSLWGRAGKILMHRVTKNAPLNSDLSVKLGTLDRDYRDIELVLFAAPVLWIKAAPREDRPVPNLKIVVVAADQDPAKGLYIDLLTPDEDGRYRTWFLPPDREVLVKVTADGFAEATRKISLPEGKVEEVAFVLEPK